MVDLTCIVPLRLVKGNMQKKKKGGVVDKSNRLIQDDTL